MRNKLHRLSYVFLQYFPKYLKLFKILFIFVEFLGKIELGNYKEEARMNNNYKIVRTIFENVFQRVLECKDNDTGEIFYSNIITSEKVIKLIDLEELQKIPSNILECYNTEDRIYIFTKPLKNEIKGLKDTKTGSLALKQQFNISEKVINLAQDIFTMTDVVQQKILDINKLYIDANYDVFVDLNLIFEQEYDIADNETFKRLGNIIHYIFSGNEIIDYNISDSISPDILKIIVRCLTREYMYPKDVLTEMKSSPIYAMIFGEQKIDTKKAEDERNKKNEPEVITVIDKGKQSYEYDNNDEYDDSPVLDIYVNDNNPKPKSKKVKLPKKDITRAAVSIIIVAAVLFAGNKIIKNLSDAKATNGKPTNSEIDTDVKNPTNSEQKQGDTELPDISDSSEIYFNDELLNNVGYTGSKAEVDKNIYLEGNSSLVVSNEGEETIKKLFTVIDFKDEKFSYMLKQQIGIAVKMKSQTDVDAQIVFEAYKDGKLTSNFHTPKIKIYDDMWSPFNVPINVTDADSLNIYLEYAGKNIVWLDDIIIDTMK